MAEQEEAARLMENSGLAFLQGIHFLHSEWLWAWLLSVMVVTLLIRCQCLGSLKHIPAVSGSRIYRHPRHRLLHRLHAQEAKQHRAAVSLSRWMVYVLLLACFHLALAHPYRLGRELPKPPEYRDTLFIVDTSISMMLRDYLVGGERIDRMTILKGVLTTFIDGLQGNRIGLIIFSEQPYTLAPLTADYALLKSRVRRLEPAVLTGNTTNLGRALIYTLQKLKGSDAWNATQKPALILITDVNRSPRDLDPAAVATYLHEQGFRLHTIGIGTSSDAAQEPDSRGLIYEPTNFALLEKIARQGGGQFFWADSERSLQSAIRTIQQGERRQGIAAPRYVTVPLYQWPLLTGLVLMMLLQWFGGRGRGYAG